jgi:hypothetical protein
MFDDLLDNKSEQTDQNSTHIPATPRLLSTAKNGVDKQPAEFGISDNAKLENYFKKTEKTEIEKNKFEEKIAILLNRGKKRGKQYSFIGISLSFIIFAVVIIVGYKILGQVNLFSEKIKNQEEKNNVFIDPENRCNGNVCCLASLEKIHMKRFVEVAVDSECQEGFIKNRLNCDGSLFWCEEEVADDSQALYDQEQNDGNPDNNGNSDIEGEANETGDDNQGSDSGNASTTISDINNNSGLGAEMDSDNDELTDQEEQEYGTDTSNPDTDGDGYLDGEEVNGGYNPLGEGKLF